MFGDTADPANPNPQGQTTSEARQRLEDSKNAPSPRVGSVPERPRVSGAEDRKALLSGLAADREAARYTDEELRGRPASTASVVPPPAATAAASASAAPAAPAAAPQPPAPAPAPVRQAAAPSAVTTAPLAAPAAPPPAVAPITASPQPVAQTVPPAVAYATAPPVAPGPATVRPVATMPPPPTTGPVAPIRDTAVLQSTYLAALAQSAATVTTAPANAAFATARPAPLQQPATAIPANVLQTYRETVPAAAYTAAAPVPVAMPAAPVPAAYSRAGSRLVGTIDFPGGSAALDRRDREAISTALADNNSRGGGTIRVVGYAPAGAGGTSQLGAFRLAQDRATAVANELVREGASRQTVYVEGRNASPGTPANRVEVYLEN